MNIVVDTNVLISAVLWKGPPSDALKIILEKYSLVQSQSTLKEFEKVITREKFTRVLESGIGAVSYYREELERIAGLRGSHKILVLEDVYGFENMAWKLRKFVLARLMKAVNIFRQALKELQTSHKYKKEVRKCRI